MRTYVEAAGTSRWEVLCSVCCAGGREAETDQERRPSVGTQRDVWKAGPGPSFWFQKHDWARGFKVPPAETVNGSDLRRAGDRDPSRHAPRRLTCTRAVPTASGLKLSGPRHSTATCVPGRYTVVVRARAPSSCCRATPARLQGGAAKDAQEGEELVVTRYRHLGVAHPMVDAKVSVLNDLTEGTGTPCPLIHHGFWSSKHAHAESFSSTLLSRLPASASTADMAWMGPSKSMRPQHPRVGTYLTPD